MVERVRDCVVHGRQAEEVVIPVTALSLGVSMVGGLASSHSPYALVLGCSDARAPLESVLDCAANEVFVVRVAGNVLGLECLGSIQYAVSQLRQSLRTVVVMGHTGCGAVSAAVDVYLTPSDFPGIAFSHALRSVVDRVLLTVRGSDRAIKRVLGGEASKSPAYRQLLIDTAVYMNAAMTAHDLQREVSGIAAEMQVVYSVFDVAHSRLGALPAGDADASTPPFAAAPVANQDFEAAANQVVGRLADQAAG